MGIQRPATHFRLTERLPERPQIARRLKADHVVGGQGAQNVLIGR